MTESKVAAIICAAGFSKRLGQRKQLLSFKGSSLLRRSVQVAIDSLCSPVVAVVAPDPLIEKELDNLPIKVVINDNRAQGMSSSIKLGLQQIEKQDDIIAAIFMVCDQPFVFEDLINQIYNTYHSQKKCVIACEYKDTLGVPVLFDRSLFTELNNLEGDRGAKKVINNHITDTIAIPFPKGAIDIDTLEDYQKLQKKEL